MIFGVDLAAGKHERTREGHAGSAIALHHEDFQPLARVADDDGGGGGPDGRVGGG